MIICFGNQCARCLSAKCLSVRCLSILFLIMVNTQLLKTAQCEYMEDELWEFMEKNVHPILLSSREGKGSDAHVASSCTRDGLQD